ncbi:AP-5 complex subunit mu-1 [Tachysurus ichikawai]
MLVLSTLVLSTLVLSYGLPDEIIIEKRNKGDTFVESIGVDVKISNLKFIQHDAIEGILCVRQGRLEMENCVLQCETTGVIVRTSSQLIMNMCDLYGSKTCHVFMGLYRNLMGNVEIKVTSGQLEVSKEKNLLVWFLGQKFPKSREVTLDGTIHFSGHVAGPSDPMCTDLTAYVKLYFRVPEMTLSGCCVDQHSVQVYSSTKPRIITTRELVSSDYYIWNSTGDAPVCSGPVTL